MGTTTTLEVFRPSWKDLCSAAVLVTSRVRFPRGRVPLRWSQLGLDLVTEDVKQTHARLVRLGGCMVVPPEIVKELNKCSVLVAQAMKRNGFKNPWGAGYMVPLDAFTALKAEVAEVEAEFWRVVNKVIAEREQWADALKLDYTKLGEQALCTRDRLEYMPGVTFFSDEERAEITSIVESITGQIPSAEKIQQTCEFGLGVFEIEQPKILAARGVDVGALEAEAARLKTEIEACNVEATKAALVAQQDALVRRLKLREEVAREMQEKAHQRANAEFDAILNGVAAKLRSILVEIASKQKENEGQGFSETQTRIIRELVGRVKVLNIGDSESVAAMVKAVEAAIPEGATAIPAGEGAAALNRALEGVGAVARYELAMLAQDDRLGIELESDVDNIEPIDEATIAATMRARATFSIPAEHTVIELPDVSPLKQSLAVGEALADREARAL